MSSEGWQFGWLLCIWEPCVSPLTVWFRRLIIWKQITTCWMLSRHCATKNREAWCWCHHNTWRLCNQHAQSWQGMHISRLWINGLQALHYESTFSRRTNICGLGPVYVPSSLRSKARGKRGKGVRRRVTPEGQLPSNWVNEKKTELFHYIGKYLQQMPEPPRGKCFLSTVGEGVICNSPQENAESLALCSQEEADSRLLLHAAHAWECGHQIVLLKTVDTDLLILAVAF